MLGLALIAAVIGWWVGVTRNPQQGLELETHTILVQALLAGSLGAFAALVVDLVKSRAADREARLRDEAARRDREREFEITVLRQCLERLDSAYRDVKTGRRRLKAGFGALYTGRIAKDEFGTVMCNLSEQSQLDLEQLVKNAETLTGRLDPIEKLKSPVKQMERYLGEIWSEVEDVLPDLPDPVVADSVLLGRTLQFAMWPHSLPLLADVDAIGDGPPPPAENLRAVQVAALWQQVRRHPRRRDWRYHHFAGPYHKARDMLLAAIAERQLVDDAEAPSGAVSGADRRAENSSTRTAPDAGVGVLAAEADL